MKKKILTILMFSFFMFLSYDIVKGIDIGGYWGASLTGGAAKLGGDCPNSQYFCAYNNSNSDGSFRHKTIAITLAYIDHGNAQKIGNTIYVTNNTSALTAIGIPVRDDGPIKLYTTINTWCSANGRQMTSDLYNSTMLNNYFKNDPQNFRKFVSCMGINYDSLTKESIATPGDKGYRLIIEPVKTGKIWGIAYLKTIKEIAAIGPTGRYFNNSYKYQYNIYQTVNDVGITAPPTGKYTNATGNSDATIRDIASSTTGYGMALVDVKSSLPTPQTCSQKKAALATNSTEYLKLMNDTIWELLHNESITQDKIDCFSCKEYIDYYNNASNPFISHTEEDKTTMLDAIKRTGKISWANSACNVGDEVITTCESFKTANPAATYADMVAANTKWPGCYSCDPTSSNYNVRFNELMPEADKPAACKTVPERDLCDFTLDISISKNCLSTTRSHIYDIGDWGCIFASTVADDEHIKDYFIQDDMSSNRFCDVYCREEVDYQYPNNSMIVLAGQRFTIGNGYEAFPVLTPVRFKSVTTCRTTSDAEIGKIDLEKFKDEYKKADDEVKEKWDEYQVAKKKQYAVDNATNVNSYKDCNWTCDTPCTCPPGTSSCGCCGGSYKSHMKKPATVYYNDGTGNKNITPSNYCSNNKPDYSVSTKLSNYNSAVTTRSNVVKELHECNTFQYTNRKFEPEIEFAYEEEMYGNLNGSMINASKFNNTLTNSVSFSSKSRYYANGSAATATGTLKQTSSWGTSSYKGSSVDMFALPNDTTYRGKTSTIHSYSCTTDGVTCTSSTQTYESNDWVEQQTTKTYNYRLANNVYRYITKPSGLSVHTSGQAMAESSVYYDIGTSNLPVHYSRDEGDYDYLFQYNTFGELSGGDNHKFDYYIFDGGSIDITYGAYLNVYSAMLADSNVRSKLQHCNAADHLGHGMPNALSRIGLLDDFLASTCGTQHNCYVYGSDVVCDTYYEDGVKKTYVPCNQRGGGRCGSTASYKTYNQVADCVARYAITTGNVAYPSRDTAYKCTYEVEQKLIIEKDLNLIYRPISLNRPFPGQSGTNRTPGANWNSSPVINVNITSNRDTETENIYKELDPLYKITLTPALIQEIRDYNDAQDNKDVTYYNGMVEEKNGKAGYSDFNLTCIDGQHCLSKFIRNTVSIGGRSYNFSRYFSGCGIDDTGLRCNTDEEW
ncbi:MAG: hypothetical protein E7169_04360 [Firmicutes bacterium]|nr:hypothetical protein [Bacillota bacterium]